MTFSELTGRPHADVGRGDVVVCVCGAGDREVLAASLAAVRDHTDAAQALFTAGAEDADATAADLDGALAAATPADVAVVAGGCLVGPGWLDGLRAAADSDSRIGIVSALATFGGSEGDDLDSLAAELSAAAPRLRPDAAIPSASCVLIRRAALELVGPLDRSLDLPQALVDLVQRSLTHGLRHVIADDVLVGSTTDRPGRDLDGFLAERYPYLRDWREELGADEGDPLARALDVVRGDRPTSVTIDGRCLSVSVTGTAVATLDLVEGLRRQAGLRVRVLVLDGLDGAIRDRLNAVGAELLSESDADAADPTDIAHRPYQLGVPEDVRLLRRLGRRLVVTQLDCIAYRTPAYFDTAGAWREYRSLTRAGLAAVDAVVFLSPHGAADAHALGLVDAERSAVIPLAVAPDPVTDAGSSCEGEQQTPGDDGAESPRPLPELPYLLCLGTDFAHKNRRFALRLLEALHAAGRFDGTLVLAGPHVAAGSSAEEEASYLAERPGLAERVLDLGAVSEQQKRRLLADAAAVVYPTTVEGFGLIPFEAAAVGVPALFAWVSSLRDLFPEELALLVPWDAEASARAVAPVLAPGESRKRQIAGVLATGAELTLARHAGRHAELYSQVLSRSRPVGGRVGLEAAELISELERARDDFRNVHRELAAIYQDPIAAGFVGPYAIVPEELQRLTLALATRSATRDAAVALYRLARRARSV